MELKIDTIVIENTKSTTLSICRVLESFEIINLLAQTDTFNHALELIEIYAPQLVFIDLNLNEDQSWRLIQHFKTRSFDIVIVADNAELATMAFKYSVLHFLLKPVSQYQIKQVITRIQDKPQHFIVDKISLEHETVKSDNSRIYVLTANGIKVVNVDDILYCEESGNGTLLYLSNNSQIQASEQLIAFEKLPALSRFSRINQLQLINLDFLRNVINTDCSRAILENDKNFFISDTYKIDFLNKISEIAVC